MLLSKDECSLCGRILPSSFLRRCFRCGKPYCTDCTIFTDDGNIACLNCARRIVSPRKLGTKYSPLSRYLSRRARFTSRATLSFAEIEGVIGDNLPFGALRNREWWTNTRGSAQGQAWMNVGWRVQDVNMNDRNVTFIRVAGPEKATPRKVARRRASTGATKFSARRPIRRRRLLAPSKGRIARAQARLRNVEREKSSARRYRGRLKPAHAYEKRLFKPEAKPSAHE